MQKEGLSKLSYLLSLISVAERDDLRDYLYSPIFNKKEDPRLLFDHYYSNSFKDVNFEIDDKLAAKAVWPDRKFDSGRMQKLKSNLVRLILDYLEFRSVNNQIFAKKVSMLEELNLLGDTRLFPLLYKKSQDVLKISQGIDFFELRLRLATANMSYLGAHAERSKESHLTETIGAFENLVVAHVLKFAYVASNQGQIVGPLGLPDWLLQAVNQISLARVASDSLLEIYYWLYHTRLAGAKIEDLERLKLLGCNHAMHCTRSEAGDIFTGILNNFNRQIQLKDDFRLKEVFELYQNMVEVYVRKLGGRLSADHFKNIVSLGMRLGEFQWVKELLSKGHLMLELDKEERKLVMDYNNGVYLFYVGDYKAAARRLNAAMGKTKDVFYAANTRTYLLMCLFELGDSLGMESLLHSSRMFLRRSGQVAKGRKDVYLSFLRVFGKMLATPPNDQFRLQKLRAEIEDLKLSSGKEWLRQKIVHSSS